METGVAADHHVRSQESARFKILHDIDQYAAQIATIQQQLQSMSDEVEMLKQENHEHEDTMKLVAKKREECERRPHDMAVEDAMDTLFRLENVLKRLQHHNQQLQRANASHDRHLREKNKELQRVKNEHDKVISVTGYHEGYDVGNFDEMRQHVANMQELKVTIERELSGAQVVQRQKELLIVQLAKDVQEYRTKEESLHALFNKIRVLDREIQEVERSIKDIRQEDKKSDKALQHVDDCRDHVAIMALEGDKDYLRAEVDRRRAERKSLDEISKAQQYRMQQLYTRLDILNKALKDMQLDRELERSVSRTYMVTAVQQTHTPLPQTVEDVLPSDETVPVELYDLLARDNKIMNSIIARKDVLLLEKASTMSALQAKVSDHEESLRITTEQQDQAKIDKVMDMEDLQKELSQRHQEYRRQLEDLVRVNQLLKGQVKTKVMRE